MVYMVYDYGLSLVSLSTVADVVIECIATHIFLETVLATLDGCSVNPDDLVLDCVCRLCEPSVTWTTHGCVFPSYAAL